MFERFTDQARRSVVLASEAARAHHHDYLGTEHILLGLIREHDGAAAKSLEAFGVSAAIIDSRLTTGQGEQTRSGNIPFTRHAKRILEQSMRETSLLGHERIGTEQILLALIDDDRESTGARLLGEVLPVDFDQLRQHILRQVTEHRLTAELGLGPTQVTNVRLTDAEHALCVVAAAKAGQRIDVWMRDRILDAARSGGASTE
ncbi:ATP-binding protease [Rhodococcus opacus M213]|uniref:ATP-binding protease n=2 Tax=Rhodococcus opacus TaxID=37919 RepID=K8XC54_RHOOP|nr:Clp protease N-terminal domain-containing protein [Rhodococcus opacus]ANS27981.1 ATP-binding protease [Rhodococcus opacus]EKT78974.1 ATP-binding protease [Rhodococcus opacus M213]UOT03859.1 ATP-binding protein [Rhodococcus opacus]